MRYRWVGNYPQDFGAVVVGPGEYVEVDEEQLEISQELVDTGLLIEAPNGGQQGGEQQPQSFPPQEGGEE